VLAILLVYLVVTVIITKHGLKRSNNLLDFSIGDVTSFTVMNDRVKLVFRRTQSTWNIDGLPKIRVSKPDIDGYIDDLRQIGIAKKIKEPGALSTYGLDVTNASLTLVVSGKPSRIIRGSPTPSGNGFYAGLDHKVFVLDKKVLELFTRDLFFFRSKRLLDISSDMIGRAELGFRGTALTIVRDWTAPKESAWRLVSPSGRNLKTEDVNTFLFEMEELEAKEFVDGRGLNLPYYGLPSNDRIILTEKNGTRNEVMLGNDGPKGVYAAVNNDMSILYVIDRFSSRTALSNNIRTFTSP
jgi:hypothetical protein